MLSYIWIALVLGTIIAYIGYNLFFHPLARVPGPILAQVSPLWLAWQCKHHRRPKLDLALHRQYGSVVRIAPDEVIFANPAYFKSIYGTGSARTYARSSFLTVHNQNKGDYDRLNMLLEVDIDKLRLQRRIFGPAYSTENARKHESLIDNNYQRWALRLNNLEGQIIDLYPEVELLSVDLFCEVTFGQAYGAVERGSDGGHMESTAKRWSWLGWIGVLPWYCKLQYELMKRNVPFSQFNLPFPVSTWAVGKISEHASAEKSFQDPSEPSANAPNDKYKALFTHTMHDTSSSPSKKSLANEDSSASCLYHDIYNTTKLKTGIGKSWAQDMAMTNIGAGIDTTSWTLATVITTICTNPSAYSQLRNELDNALKSGIIERHAPIPYDRAANLPYLQACMKEAQRLLPNIAVSLARIVPAEGIKIDDYFIPSGCVVGMNSRQLGQSGEVFGADLESFHPERWLTASKERLGDMESRNLAFGGPSRKCPGMYVAWVAMSKILAGLFVNFDVEVLNTLDGPPGPGGRKWREIGSFSTMWRGVEAQIRSRR